MGGLFYLKIWLPVTNIPVPCVFHELTGLYCPGCGMTRTALSLLNLDVYQAIRYNLLAFLIPPLYIAYTLANKNQMRWASRWMMAVMLTVTLMFGLLRNLPALEWLAPTTLR
ncbi:hypothetical protein GCM10010911_44500 [Paenibacillus nasutitermitis]|uniref:DUF2752 domain-containing protein n=2 Tax=Paenibacillus nasutitermitis TaxID=1652958 RepID=A0A916Z8K5_9BACL|nr:hypothetical protein GCM10010911_44500 [Paenibacillus nasutitermitis]